MITRNDVEKVAILARLKLSETEMELFTNQLNKVLESFDILKSVDTNGIEPTAHPIAIETTLREDKIENLYNREDLLKIVPEEENGYIKVPKILDESIKL